MVRIVTPPTAGALRRQPRRAAAHLGPLLLLAAGGAVHFHPPLRGQAGPARPFVAAAASNGLIGHPGCLLMATRQARPRKGVGIARQAESSVSSTDNCEPDNATSAVGHGTIDVEVDNGTSAVALARSPPHFANARKMQSGYDNDVLGVPVFLSSHLDGELVMSYQTRLARANGNRKTFWSQEVNRSHLIVGLGGLESKVNHVHVDTLKELKGLWPVADCPAISQKKKKTAYERTRGVIAEKRKILAEARRVTQELQAMCHRSIDLAAPEDHPREPFSSRGDATRVEEIEAELSRIQEKMHRLMSELNEWSFLMMTPSEKTRNMKELADTQEREKELGRYLQSMKQQEDGYVGQKETEEVAQDVQRRLAEAMSSIDRCSALIDRMDNFLDEDDPEELRLMPFLLRRTITEAIDQFRVVGKRTLELANSECELREFRRSLDDNASAGN